MSAKYFKQETNNNPNIIVTLVAQSYRASVAWADPHNASFYLPPMSQATDGPPPEKTVCPDGVLRAVIPNPNDPNRVKPREPALQIAFSTKPKNPKLGYLLGSDPELCDIILGSQEDYINQLMTSISVNSQNEVIMRTWSITPIAVTYGTHTEERGVFTWLFLPDQDNIFVNIQDTIMFAVVAPTHETDRRAYEAGCRKSMMLVNRASHMFQVLDLVSRPGRIWTNGFVIPSVAREAPFYLSTAKIGKGSFGKVYKARSMPIGEIVAEKTFKSKKVWKMEVEILKEVSKTPHDHIVQFIDYGLGAKPYLIMGLALGGNLAEQNKIDAFKLTETVLVLRQMLEALAYLHDHCKMTHRDIKPGNILCDSRTHFRLADFGSAKEGEVLETHKGTESFMAPEAFSTKRYTAAVDLWALGMVIAWLLNSLPTDFKGDWGLRWCEAVVQSFKGYEKVCSQLMMNDHIEQNGLNLLVGQYMLRMEPGDRESAMGCLDKGETLWHCLDQVSKRDSKAPPTENPIQQTADCEENEALEKEIERMEKNIPQEELESPQENSSDAETEIPTMNSSDWADLEREFPHKPADVQGHLVYAPPIDPSGNLPEESAIPGGSGQHVPNLHDKDTGTNKRKRSPQDASIQRSGKILTFKRHKPDD